MNGIAIKAIGGISVTILKRLAKEIETGLDARCRILAGEIDPHFAFDSQRGQYVSTMILDRLNGTKPPDVSRIIGITEADLFIPIFTFVFGEAQLQGDAAIVSIHRLRSEFYGLPPDQELLFKRALKESIHELGHTFGLRHCHDYNCVMHASNSVEDVDLKGSGFCKICRKGMKRDSEISPVLHPDNLTRPDGESRKSLIESGATEGRKRSVGSEGLLDDHTECGDYVRISAT